MQSRKPTEDTIGAIFSSIGHIVVLYDRTSISEIVQDATGGGENEIMFPVIAMDVHSTIRASDTSRVVYTHSTVNTAAIQGTNGAGSLIGGSVLTTSLNANNDFPAVTNHSNPSKSGSQQGLAAQTKMEALRRIDEHLRVIEGRYRQTKENGPPAHRFLPECKRSCVSALTKLELMQILQGLQSELSRQDDYVYDGVTNELESHCSLT